MTVRVAINGFGRIGRNVLRAHYEGCKKNDIQIVAINDLGDAKSNAHLTRYDTAHGKFPGTVPTVWIMNYLQAQHIDLEYYDKVLTDTAYLSTHRDHQELWH